MLAVWKQVSVSAITNQRNKAMKQKKKLERDAEREGADYIIPQKDQRRKQQERQRRTETDRDGEAGRDADRQRHR